MPSQVTSQLIWNITYLALNITYTFIDEFVTISYSCAEERPSRTKAPLHTKKLKLSPLSQNSKKRKKHTAGRLSILTYTRKETWLTASDSKTCKVCFYNFGVQQARGSAPLIFRKRNSFFGCCVLLLWTGATGPKECGTRQRRVLAPEDLSTGMAPRIGHPETDADQPFRDLDVAYFSRKRCRYRHVWWNNCETWSIRVCKLVIIRIRKRNWKCKTPVKRDLLMDCFVSGIYYCYCSRELFYAIELDLSLRNT